MSIRVWCELDYDDDDPNDPDNRIWVPMNNPGWEVNALWAHTLTEQIDGLSTDGGSEQ